MKGYIKILITVLILPFVSLPVAVMAGYILEPGFGNSGIVDDDIGGDDRAYSMAIQPDGKILVAGTSDLNSNSKQVVVARYNSDGSADTTFNKTGVGTFQIATVESSANSITILSDGSIIIAGYAQESVTEKNIFVMKLTSTGIQDIDFGTSGVATLQITDIRGEAFDIVIDSSGRILVGGILESDTDTWAVAARFTDKGELDSSFGTNGYAQVEDGDKTSATSVALQSDGKIILTGMKEASSSLKTATLFRLNEDGAVDTSFGVNGQVFLNGLTADSRFYSATILSDDAIIAVGYTTANGRRSMTTAKFKSTGPSDTSFGQSGVVINDLGTDGAAYSISVKSDDTLLIAGEAMNDSNFDIILLNLDAQGQKLGETAIEAATSEQQATEGSMVEEPALIATLREGRAVYTDIKGQEDYGRDLVALDEDEVIITGFTDNSKDDDIALIKFIDDSRIGTGGGGTSPTDLPYYIGTIPVYNVTRNSAMSGGVISVNSSYVCVPVTTNTTCTAPTVTARGVVYGVAAYPSYEASTSDTSTGTTEGDGTTGGNSVFPDWTADRSHNYDLVRKGQTSDGSDYGTYGSDINKVTPDSFYYVRAYAVLSDDTVLYGNQLTFKTDDACFIATAAYGSLLDSHVKVLREFRDTYLKTTEIGKDFVGFYYHWSPALAEFISQSSLLRFAVRLALLPFVAISYFMVHLSLQLKFVFILLMGCSFFFTKRILARR